MVIQGIVFIRVAQAGQDPAFATSLVPVGKWGAARGAGQLRRDPSALPGDRALECRHRPPAGAGREVVTEGVITDGDVKARHPAMTFHVVRGNPICHQTEFWPD